MSDQVKVRTYVTVGRLKVSLENNIEIGIDCDTPNGRAVRISREEFIRMAHTVLTGIGGELANE